EESGKQQGRHVARHADSKSTRWGALLREGVITGIELLQQWGHAIEECLAIWSEPQGTRRAEEEAGAELHLQARNALRYGGGRGGQIARRGAERAGLDTANECHHSRRFIQQVRH